MGFGSMCRTSSPKDPMFWRWHGFIDLMYRNYCVVDGIACLSPLPAGSDPWMGDNPADIAAIGQPPSPHPRWISPDIWVRRTLASCTPASPVPGAARDCGSSADHENPLANTVNYVYATLRNDRPNAQRVVYAEVAVYYANASTGLSWPADFTIIPQSRQFITLNLEPGQTVDIGPVEWTPPSPTPSDHWCLYIRIRTIQEPPQAEGANVDINVRDSNSITWRNVRIVTALLAEADVASFLVRNIWPDPQPLSLEIVTPEAIVRGGVTLLPDETLARRIREGGVRIAGLRAVEGGFAITAPKATIAGLTLQPREARVVRLRVTRAAPGEIQVVQRSREGVDGGVTIQVRRARQRGSRRR
jgi:hypothetical protein